MGSTPQPRNRAGRLSSEPSRLQAAAGGHNGLGRFARLFAAVSLTVLLAAGAWAAQQPPPSLRLPRPVRTNLPPGAARSARTNAVAQRAGGTNSASAAGKAARTDFVSSLSQSFQRFKASPAFYPSLVGAVIVILGLLLLRERRSKKKQTAALSPALSKAVGKRKGAAGASTVHGCNVLELGTGAQHLWQFDARANSFSLSREHTSAPGEGLPSKWFTKTWRSLFYRKLNVAWLPPEHVFLRAAQFPQSDFHETLSMVELQLEKLSPLPVAQIVWSIHILPHAEGNLQTVILMIVARSVVEEFLGKLEGQGYLADRLELPLLEQLQTTAITEDGAWIYPEAAGGKNNAVVAWWYGGVLQSVDLLHLSGANPTGSLKEQLTQMAWAGELEGWLSKSPDWHLVADGVVAGEWEPLLRNAVEQPVEVSTPIAPRELAALTARRAAQSDPRATLMPPEFAERYQQQFVDRLWLRGLLAVGGIYAIGVAIYMIALGVVNYKTGNVETEVAQMGRSYTNALQLKARYQVLKDRQELKYAALDCWNATAQYLPDGVTLDSFNFSQGKRLHLDGTAPSDSIGRLNEFESSMRKHTVNGQPLFDPTRGETLTFRVQGQNATWGLGFELKRGETEP